MFGWSFGRRPLDLPKGIALVRVQSGDHRVLLLSETLSPDQELAARILAAVLAIDEQPYVMLRMVDVLAAMTAAA